MHFGTSFSLAHAASGAASYRPRIKSLHPHSARPQTIITTSHLGLASTRLREREMQSASRARLSSARVTAASASASASVTARGASRASLFRFSSTSSQSHRHGRGQGQRLLGLGSAVSLGVVALLLAPRRTEAETPAAPMERDPPKRIVSGQELAQHTTPESLWLVVDGQVWDVTEWIPSVCPLTTYLPLSYSDLAWLTTSLLGSTLAVPSTY